MEYKKLPKTFNEQVKLIRDRGLVIGSESRVKIYLKHISYYHLSAYFKSFQKGDKFNDGVTFEDVIRLYEFDKKLRLLLFDVLERIEKAFKCSVVYNLSIKYNNPFWYADKKIYLNEHRFNECVSPILDSIKVSREVSVKHFYKKYKKTEFPPSWIALEVVTFGGCVKLCKQLNRSEQNLFSRSFGLDRLFFLNWMHGLSMIRNICAHHSRLWNKNILKVKCNHREYSQLFVEDKESIMKLYNWLVVMKIMMEKINPKSDWINKLKLLINEYNIPISSMGFPKNWKDKIKNK